MKTILVRLVICVVLLLAGWAIGEYFNVYLQDWGDGGYSIGWCVPWEFCGNGSWEAGINATGSESY